MDTPIYNHITSSDYEHVYEPAEDTFLMLDALEKDLNTIKAYKPLVCVEIGSGAGLNITAVSSYLKKNAHCIAIDINERACRITKKTGAINSATIDVIVMDLVSSFRYQSVDLLIFNPPYVPTPNSEYFSSSIAEAGQINSRTNENLIKSWAGGIDGRQVIDRVLANLEDILSVEGVFYLLVVKENKPFQIIEKLETCGFVSVIVIERKIRGEHLFVIRIKRV